MTATPLPGQPPKNIRDALWETTLALRNIRGVSRDGFQLFNEYLGWANTATSRLSLLLRPGDIDRLVLTKRHWALIGLDPVTQPNTLYGLVALEIDQRDRAFQAEVDEFDVSIKKWDGQLGVVVVPDTNVLLHHPSAAVATFENVDWCTEVGALSPGAHLVLPMILIDELDRLKRTGKDTTRTQARLALRRLDQLIDDPAATVQLRPEAGPELGPVTLELFLDQPGHERLPIADDELVDRAAALKDISGRRVVVLAYDHGTRVRAKSAGVEGIKPPRDETK